MRRRRSPNSRRWLQLAVVAITAAGITIVIGVNASATPASDLFVNNTTAAHCSDHGSGTAAQPFCTIAEATKTARAGQTVTVTGIYNERLSPRSSGTSAAPITFQASAAGAKLEGATASVSIRNHHDIVVSGFSISGTKSGASVLVGHSSGVTIKNLEIDATLSHASAIDMASASNSSVIGGNGIVSAPATAIVLDAGTSHVTVHGFDLQEDLVDFRAGTGLDVAGVDDQIIATDVAEYTTNGIVIEKAAKNTVVAQNGVVGSLGDGIVVKGSGTDITSNIVAGNCWTGVRVESTATHTYVENNVVSENGSHLTGIFESSSCTPKLERQPVEIGVYGKATATTTADYNTVCVEDQPLPLYAWISTHATLAGYRKASGQGAHDILAKTLSEVETNPDLDSANSAAPGEQPTDSQGAPYEDDPNVPNTGAGPITYADRGIYEEDHGGTVTPTVTVDQGTKTVTVDASHATPGWSPIASYIFDWADGTKTAQASPIAHHTYTVRNTYDIVVYVVSKDGFVGPGNEADTQIGASFVAIKPVRILDSLTGVGISKGQLPAHAFTPFFPGPLVPFLAKHPTGMLLDVTVLNGKSSGSASIFGTDGPYVSSSNLHWKAGQTVSNLVEVQPGDNGIALRNNSAGKVDMIVDVVGYNSYANGSYYHAAGPTPVGATKPIKARSSVTLSTTGLGLPASVTSVALSVTASNQKSAGALTVYSGSTRPAVSNVHWSLRQPTTDMVVVPVVSGAIHVYNASDGGVDVGTDLLGYYSTTATQFPTDMSTVRILDTATKVGVPTSTPVAAHGSVTLATSGVPALANTGATAVILNMTVTAATKSGNLVVYPDGQARPATTNLAWSAGQTVSDLVIVPVVNGKIHFYNNSAGTVTIIGDLQGYFTP